MRCVATQHDIFTCAFMVLEYVTLLIDMHINLRLCLMVYVEEFLVSGDMACETLSHLSLC